MKWALGAILLAMVPVAGALSTSRVFYVRDLALYFWPRHQWLRATWAAGEWPWWDPYIGAGQSAVADALNQFFLLPVTAVRLLAPEVIGFNIWVAAPFPLAAAGAWLWLRRHVSPPAALVGASVWTLSGPMLSTGNFPNLSWSAAFIPWVLWGAERMEGRAGARAVAVLAVIVGCQALSGEPVTLAATCAIAVAYALASPRAILAWRERVAGIAWRVVIGIAAGVLLAAVQLVPLADSALRSPRGQRIADNFWALHPLALVETVLPHFFGHGYYAAPNAFPWIAAINSNREPLLFSLYVGVGALALALVRAGRNDLRRWRIFWWAVALVSVLCAVGHHTPFYGALQAVVPPLRSFRFAVKYVLFAGVAIAALAAAGADALLRHARGQSLLRRPVAAWVVLGLFVAVSSIVALANTLAPGGMLRGYAALARAVELQDPLEGARWLAGPVTPLWVRLAALSFFAALLTTVAWRRPRGAMVAVALLGGLAVVDPLAVNADLNPTIAPAAIGAPAWLRSTRAHPEDRVYVGGVLRAGSRKPGARNVDAPARMNFPAEQPFTQALVTIGTQFAMAPAQWRVRQVISHDLPELWPLEYREVLVDFLTRPFEDRVRFLRRTGVRYCALPRPPEVDAVPIQSLAPLFVDFDLYECNDAPRRAYVTAAARIEPDRPRRVDLLFDPAHDPWSEAVLERPAPQPAGTPGAPSPRPDAAIVRERNDEVIIRATAGAGGGYLVLLDSYDPHWRVTVDGMPATLLQADVLFRGVRLAPGPHEVSFTYRPVPLFAGLATSVATCIGLLAACLRQKNGAP